MKRTTVFSLVREQSVFMTAIMGLLTFLAVMALGIAIAIGTGVSRWNTQWIYLPRSRLQIQKTNRM